MFIIIIIIIISMIIIMIIIIMIIIIISSSSSRGSGARPCVCWSCAAFAKVWLLSANVQIHSARKALF